MFFLWAITAGLLQFGYYCVNNWMPTYLEKELGMNFKAMTTYMVGTYTAMIVGKFLPDGWPIDLCDVLFLLLALLVQRFFYR